MKARKVWTPPQMEDRARLISMKKNRKLQMGGKSIRRTASGYATNARLGPPYSKKNQYFIIKKITFFVIT